jgi:hypothetical protein
MEHALYIISVKEKRAFQLTEGFDMYISLWRQ